MLLVMPILCGNFPVGARGNRTDPDWGGVRGSGLGREVAEESYLGMGTEGSMFEFVLYHTEEELKQAVRARQAECAYLFPEGFEEKK